MEKRQLKIIFYVEKVIIQFVLGKQQTFLMYFYGIGFHCGRFMLNFERGLLDLKLLLVIVGVFFGHFK